MKYNLQILRKPAFLSVLFAVVCVLLPFVILWMPSERDSVIKIVTPYFKEREPFIVGQYISVGNVLGINNYVSIINNGINNYHASVAKNPSLWPSGSLLITRSHCDWRIESLRHVRDEQQLEGDIEVIYETTAMINFSGRICISNSFDTGPELKFPDRTVTVCAVLKKKSIRLIRIYYYGDGGMIDLPLMPNKMKADEK